MAKVYVSSTVVDLKAERQAVIDWLVAAGHQPVHSYSPDSETVRESCLEDIDGCDLYVLILSHRYGFQPEEDNPEKLSITQMEFRRAKHSEKPRIALLRTSEPDVRLSDLLDPVREPLVAAFYKEVQSEVRPAEFSDLKGLLQGLSTGVQRELDKNRQVVLADDPRTLQIVATLTDQLARKDKLIDERESAIVTLQGRVKELEQELLHSAVARTLTAAVQPDAGPAEIDAAHALAAGDTRPAEVLLSKQEHHEAAQIGTPGVDDVSQRQQAAALAREQGALAMGHDVAAALASFQRAAEYEPDDTWTHFFIGDLHLSAGNLDAAMKSFRNGLARVETRLQASPNDSDAERDLSVSYNRIGDVLVAQGDGPAALTAYRKALKTAESRAALDPAKTLWQRDLSVSHNRIGKVLATQGDGTGAMKSYRKGLEIAEALAARDAANTDWQRDLCVSHNSIGDVLVAQGDGTGAMKSYRKGLEIVEALAARDAANALWQRDLAISHNKIGDVLVGQGDGAGALKAYQKALVITEALAARDPANTEWQRDIAVSCSKLGTLAHGQDIEARRDYLRRGRGILAELKTKNQLTPGEDWIPWFDDQLVQLTTDQAKQVTQK